MNSAILGLALFLLMSGVKSDLKEDMHKINEACRSETHVSQDEVKSFFTGQMKDEPSEAFKCHMKCFMEKKGHWNDGGFDSAAASKYLQEMLQKMTDVAENEKTKIATVLEECKDKKGANDCDTAYLIAKCFHEHHQFN